MTLTPVLPTVLTPAEASLPGAAGSSGGPLFGAALAAVAGLGPACGATSRGSTGRSGTVGGASPDGPAADAVGSGPGSCDGTPVQDVSSATGTAPAGPPAAELVLLLQLAGLGVSAHGAPTALITPPPGPSAAGGPALAAALAIGAGSAATPGAVGRPVAPGTAATALAAGTAPAVDATTAAATTATATATATAGPSAGSSPSTSSPAPSPAPTPEPSPAAASATSAGTSDPGSGLTPAAGPAATGGATPGVAPWALAAARAGTSAGAGAPARGAGRAPGTPDVAGPAPRSPAPARSAAGGRGSSVHPVDWVSTPAVGDVLPARGSAGDPGARSGRAAAAGQGAAEATGTAPVAAPGTPVAGSGPASPSAGDPASGPPVATTPAQAASGPATVAPDGATSAAAGSGPPAPVPDQVLRHLTAVRALREGWHRTVLRLEPEHLGEVTVTLDVRSGAVRMAVSGGAEALAAVREGLGHLRSSLADSGLDLGDVALRPEAAAAGAAATDGPAPALDGRDLGSGSRPDTGAHSPDGDPPPGREQRRADAPEAPSQAPLSPVVAEETASDPSLGAGDGPRRLDVRV
ncbi:MAG TPA: flagellar hook-length control protein FliK [Kineosporiaceae bacterium]|nr:flagellar hook-length control protein FliK [Kineosporiaceae bacterium]